MANTNVMNCSMMCMRMRSSRAYNWLGAFSRALIV